MKLSWIIGSFNRPGRMRTCLASIVDQEPFGDWEAIIVDNSTDLDAAKQIEEECSFDPRIRYEHVGERCFDPQIGIRSLYTASELGARMSQGEWICFPNDDSYYAPWFAQRLLAEADSKSLEFVYCDFINGRHDIMHYPLSTAPVSCSIDKTCFMFKREWMPESWPGKITRYGIADGDLVEYLVLKGIRYGKVPQFLVTHN
jgi:glycosyltransferase involved in cell wall biosynthesis